MTTTQRTEQLASIAYVKGAQVDSVLASWNAQIMNGIWAGVGREFTDRGLSVNAFHDGPTFSAAIRALIAQYRDNGGDKSVFIDQVWKGRIHSEWKDVLEREGVLGKTEFASLDQAVNELNASHFNVLLISFIIGVVVVAIGLWWWLLARKRSKAVEPKHDGPIA